MTALKTLAKEHRHTRQEEIFQRLGVTRCAAMMGMGFDKAKNHKRSLVMGDAELKSFCNADGSSFLAETIRFTPFLENSENLSELVALFHRFFGSDDVFLSFMSVMHKSLNSADPQTFIEHLQSVLTALSSHPHSRAQAPCEEFRGILAQKFTPAEFPND